MIEVLEHTADVRLRITAASTEDLFREALRGTMLLLHPETDDQTVERTVVVDSADRTTLLIDFLNEVLSLAHVHHEAYERAHFDALTETHLVARLQGCDARAFGEDVKAVTYHEAEIVQAKGVWTVTIVYDI